MQEQEAGSILTMLREMQKWGFSLIQANTAKQQPFTEQIERARIVARQFLCVSEDTMSEDVERVANGIIDVSARSEIVGGFVSPERRTKVEYLDIPFRNNTIPQEAQLSGLSLIEKDGMDVINVETLFARGFLGAGRAIGIRVWYRM